MRKDNSDLVTKFITKTGDFKKNRDYFAYVELDDMVCWVLADGIDSATDNLSSEIVAGTILSEFSDNPSLKKRHIKKYLKEAQANLMRESRTIKLKSTVLIIISDYSSIRWASLGNTRLYHLRKNRIKNKTKDQSVAQMMLEVGDIGEKQLNRHEERNNLTQFLGQDKRLKPQISGKIKLKDDDVLLMLTSGFWEHLKSKKIEDNLKEAKEPDEFLTSLENIILSKDVSRLDNYSAVTVFVNKVFKEKPDRKKEIIKKIATIIVPIIIFTGGYLVYSKIRRVKALKATKLKKKRLRVSKIKNSLTQEKQGDKLAKKAKYKKALDHYNKAHRVYDKFKQDKKVKQVVTKIKNVNKIITGQSLEKRADDKFKAKNYEQALAKYEEAKISYLKAENYVIQSLEEKISNTKDLLEAIAYEEDGDMFLESDSYLVAKEKYNNAKLLYKNNDLSDLEKRVEKKLSKVDILIKNNQKIVEVKKIENKADTLFQNDNFKKANLSYIKAKVMYSELGKTKKVQQINTKIKNVELKKVRLRTQRIEKNADSQFEQDKYNKALINYEQAQQTFSELSNNEAKQRIAKKIKDTKQIIQASKFIAVAEKAQSNQKLTEAINNYKQAKEIYLEYNMQKQLEETKLKLKVAQDKKAFITAKTYEDQAQKQLKKERYEQAINNYKQAKKIYLEYNMAKQLEKIKIKIKVLQNKKRFIQAKKYEQQADKKLEKEEYDNAIGKYKQAEKIYLKLGKTDDSKRTKKKLNLAQKQKKKFLFIF